MAPNPRMSRLSEIVGPILIFVTILATPAALTRSASASTKDMTSSKTQMLYCGFWRTDHTFEAKMRLRNILANSSLSVVPVLYMSDGTEYDLPAVRLPASGIVSVDISQALKSAPMGVLAHLSEFGSAAVRYTSGWHAVEASTQIRDNIRSLNYWYPFFEGAQGTHGRQTQFLDGLWWRRDQDTGGFIGISNTTSEALSTAIRATGAKGFQTKARVFNVGPHATEMVDLSLFLTELPEHQKREGGLEVTYEGSVGEIIVSGGLINELKGYSANVPFSLRDAKNSKTTLQQYASVGIMAGRPDPMMNFPQKTRFEPYMVLRNTSSDTLTVGLVANIAKPGTTQNVKLSDQLLLPHETRQLKMREMLGDTGLRKFDGMLNLKMTFLGRPPDLLIASGSVDNTGTYVFEVSPKEIADGYGQDVGFWDIENGDDTMITLWNPESSPEDLVLTLNFEGGTGSYFVPVHLDGQASTMVSLMELIMESKPDSKGNMLPSGLTEGNASISSAKGFLESTHVLESSGIFNVHTATCTSGCTVCPGVVTVLVDPGSFAVPRTTTKQLQYKATQGTGTISYGTAGTWGTTNATVATVSTGLVNGLSAGGVTISDVISFRPYSGACPIPKVPFHCPATKVYSPGSPGQVGPYQVEPLATASQGVASCSPNTWSGWVRNVTNQVQYSNGSPFAFTGLAVTDTLTVGSRRDLGSGTSTGSATTTGDGSFPDIYSICSSVCPGSTGETDALQSWAVSGLGLPHANGVIYKCNSISIDGR